MKLTKTQSKAVHKEVDGFDGGVWKNNDTGRKFVVIATHGWANMHRDGTVGVAVALQALEPEEGEPNTYVMERELFFEAFSRVEDDAQGG